MADAPYSYSAVSAYLMLNGTYIPIVRAMVTYQLNTLPTATVTVPLGRNAITGAPSPIQTIFALTEPTPCKLMMNLTPMYGVQKDFGIAAGDVVLFDGYTSGMGYAKSMQPPLAEFTFTLRHWLSELDYSSTLSQYSVPNNPADYTAKAIIGIQGTGASGSGKTTICTSYDYKNCLDEGNIQKDFWTDALWPFFGALCTQEGLQVMEQGDWTPEAPPPVAPLNTISITNEVAYSALLRISARPALKLNLAGSTDALSRLIHMDLNDLIGNKDYLAGNTIWSCLVGGCAAEYMFAVIPRTSDALVVPYIATPKDAYVKITPDEYASAQISGEIPRPIRAYGILSSYFASSGSDGRANSGPYSTQRKVGGWYIVPNRKLGVVRIEPAPRWAGGAIGEYNNPKDSSAAFGKNKSSTDQPKAAGAPNTALKQQSETNALSSACFLTRYARMRMAYEQFVNRQGIISGPVRMDICPGSSVQVVASTDPFLKIDTLNTSFFGTVLAMTTVLDIMTNNASTSFHLGHVRTEQENAVEANSLGFHPLYTDVFLGSGMTG